MTSIPADIGAFGAIAAKFRTCPATGLKVDLAAERLIKANAVAAVVFLAIGGLFGLLVALTRWPAVHLLPFDWFYLILTAHGLDVLLLVDHLFRDRGALFRFRRHPVVPPRRAAMGLGRLCVDGGRRPDDQRRGVAGQFVGDVHLLRASAGAAPLLSRT